MNIANRPFDPSVIGITDEIIQVANEAYHDVEASMYDDSHPEILWCEKSHWEMFGQKILSPLVRPLMILDIGAGTGFVGSVIGAFLQIGDRYVASDISEKMLLRLQENLRGSPYTVETIKTDTAHINYSDGTFDVIVVNSALHHFPDVEATLHEASRLLRSGGILAIMHEPNIRFTRSSVLKMIARFASIGVVLAGKIKKNVAHLKNPRDYQLAYDSVNLELLKRRLILQPLSNTNIQALVDVSSPTARGTYEEVGFDPFSWTVNGGVFFGWRILQCETYNFLGKLDPTERKWSRGLDRILHAAFHRTGYLFSLVVKKP